MNVYYSKIYQQQIDLVAREIPHSDKTILVTGATGMIGSAIIDALLWSNRNYDNRLSVLALGRNREKLSERFFYADNYDRLGFITQDITEPFNTQNQTDYIIHAASNADPVAYATHPTETLLTNIYGTNNMLQYCREHLKTRILLTSTFEVYGKTEGKERYAEDDSGEVDLNQVRSCYPESKRSAEILLRCYHKQYGVDGVIARLCSIYGPTMSDNDSKAHAQFIRNGLQGQDIVLKSKGQQKRTYCYLMDTISGIITVLFKGKSGEAYNISYEKSVTTIAEVAGAVAAACGTKVIYDLPNETERQGFSRPQNCILDNAKLCALGWRGQYTLQDGITATLDILRESAANR